MNENKLFSVVAHAACYFTSVIVGLVIPVALLSLSDDEMVKANARESINFQITMIIWAAIGVVLAFVGIGFFILIAVAIWNFVAPAIKIIQVLNTPDQPARYGFIFRFVK